MKWCSKKERFLCSLYVPSVVVVGLHGWLLPPSLIILCATVLYSEFLIHPLQRLLSNHRLRAKVL